MSYRAFRRHLACQILFTVAAGVSGISGQGGSAVLIDDAGAREGCRLAVPGSYSAFRQLEQVNLDTGPSFWSLRRAS